MVQTIPELIAFQACLIFINDSHANRCGYFDIHIGIVYDTLCQSTFVIKYHQNVI